MNLMLVGLLIAAGCGDKRDEATERKAIEEATAKGVERGIAQARAKQTADDEAKRRKDDRTRKMFSKTPEEIAGLVVKDYAYDAYPQWAGQHLEKLCPDRLAELNEYMNVQSVKDPWGRPYRMFCGSSLPAGVKGGIAVMSAGPDGREGTDDDIRSWE